MEGTITIPIHEYELLAGIKKDFDERLKSELKRMNEADRAFVLRDRDEYVRRNEALEAENRRLRDSVSETSGLNVRLRLDLDEAKARRAELERDLGLARMKADAIAEGVKTRYGVERALRDAVNGLRKERRDLLLERDAILGRGLLARIFNRRP